MGCTLDAGPVMPALAERAAAAPGPQRDDWKALRKAGETGRADPGPPCPVLLLTWTYDDNSAVWARSAATAGASRTSSHRRRFP